MTQQSDSTRQKISSMLSQIGMTDEELPQLMDEEIWLETAHTEEELALISQKITLLEQVVQHPPEGATITALEALLDGELIFDEARGFLLKKHLRNWRKGMSQFLAFLAFSKLQQLALALATLTTPNLTAQLIQTNSRPRDRQMLTDFILKQVEQPLPPIIAIVAEAGAVLGPVGDLEYHQPLTAALLQQAPEKILQLLELLKTEQSIASPTAENSTESPADLAQYQPSKKAEVSAQLNKLIVLDRVETMIANQQALQQQQSEQQQNTEQQQQPTRRRRVNRRQLQLREAEREAKETAAQQSARTETETKPQTSTRPTFTQRLATSQARPQQQVVRKPTSTSTTTTTKKATPATEPQKISKDLFGDIPLAAFQGMTVSNVDPEQLGKTKSSLPKDQSVKPITSPER